MPLSVVIVSNVASVKGGASAVAEASAIGLANLGVKVYYFAGTGPVSAKLRDACEEVMCLGRDAYLDRGLKPSSALKGLYDRDARGELERLLGRLDPKRTVVHFHGWFHSLSPAVFDAVRRRGFASVTTMHEYSLACPNMSLFDYRRKAVCHIEPMSAGCLMCNCDKRNYPMKVYRYLRTAIYRRCFRLCGTRPIFISEFSRDVLLGCKGTAELLGRGFLVKDPVVAKGAEGASCDPNGPYMFIGRVDEEKGAELFCEAATRIGVRAVVVGDGARRRALEEAYPSVEFLGWKSGEELGRLRSSARCIVFPSICYETAGLSVLEAQMAAGTPCIVADGTATSEFVSDGVDGLLFRAGSAESLARAIERMEDSGTWRALRSNVGRNGFGEYDLAGHCLKLVGVYEEVLGEM